MYEPAGDHVYFTATDPVHGVELWKSDGTAGGTVALTNFASGKEPFFYELGRNLVEEVGGDGRSS